MQSVRASVACILTVCDIRWWHPVFIAHHRDLRHRECKLRVLLCLFSRCATVCIRIHGDLWQVYSYGTLSGMPFSCPDDDIGEIACSADTGAMITTGGGFSNRCLSAADKTFCTCTNSLHLVNAQLSVLLPPSCCCQLQCCPLFGVALPLLACQGQLFADKFLILTIGLTEGTLAQSIKNNRCAQIRCLLPCA